jgi:hypothetical protein
MKKILMILLLIIFNSVSIWAQDDTIYLAVNFVNNEIIESDIVTVMASYGFRVGHIDEQDNIGFRVIEGTTNNDIISICQSLKKNGIVDIAHKIYSLNQSIEGLFDRYNGTEKKLSLMFYGSQAIEPLYQKLIVSSDFRKKNYLLKLMGILGDENDVEVLNNYLIQNKNDMRIVTFCLNAIIRIKCERTKEIIKLMLNNSEFTEIKDNIIFMIGLSGNKAMIPILKNYINDVNESLRFKILCAYSLAILGDKTEIDFVRTKLNSFQDLSTENIELLIQTIGLVGEATDTNLLQSLKNEKNVPITRAIEIAEKQIKFNILISSEKSAFVKNILDDRMNDYRQAGFGLYLLKKINITEQQIILKEVIHFDKTWNSVSKYKIEMYGKNVSFLINMLEVCYKNNLRI